VAPCPDGWSSLRTLLRDRYHRIFPAFRSTWKTAGMRVTALDHLVLNVADTRRSLDFYAGVLGLEPLRVEEWEAGDAPFVSVRIDAQTIIDLMELERSGENADHLCLVVEEDVAELAATGALEVQTGPVPRWGARGEGTSIYVRDPDGNTVELRNYR